MRFLLDHDVDARLALVFKARGHQCWTASEANLALAGDDDLTAYADDRGAVLVIHDVEFVRTVSHGTGRGAAAGAAAIYMPGCTRCADDVQMIKNAAEDVSGKWL